VQSGITTIHADPKHFRHILFSLLANAISFSGPGDSVRLAVKREGADLVIEVSDTGKGAMANGGMRQIAREHGFRFSMAKALVQLHDGRIEAAEEAQGGHVTTVILPGA
jgi:signal transduction histidine kinase